LKLSNFERKTLSTVPLEMALSFSFSLCVVSTDYRYVYYPWLSHRSADYTWLSHRSASYTWLSHRSAIVYTSFELLGFMVLFHEQSFARCLFCLQQ